MFQPLPVLALLLNAFVWGVSWWPFRWLEAQGLHPLWSTAMVYTVAMALLLAARPQALGQWVHTPSLWLIALGSGLTNAAFNWAVVIGDVVRVVLLFYLMPLWVVVFARLILHEPITRRGLLRIALALVGAYVVLAPQGGGWPMPTSTSDALGMLGGVTFALNTVILRRESHRPAAPRALSMFIGGAVVSAVLGSALALQGQVDWPPALAAWGAVGFALALMFLAANLGLQYGAARLPANATAVVLLSEVLFAATSALLLGTGRLTPALVIGGGLIVAAALLAAFERAPAAH